MFFSFTSARTRSIFIFLIVSVVISLIIIFFTPKYTARLASVSNANDAYNYYEDLNNDGNSEKISLITRYNDRLGILILTQGKIIDQWNVRGTWAQYTAPFIADIDHDDSKEIFVFTIDKDSVFLHSIHVYDTAKEATTKGVCKIYRTGDLYDFFIFPCAVYDEDGDGSLEFYFSIRAGFATMPRNMFSYNVKTNEIKTSPESCSSIFYPIMYDMDYDGIPEFFSYVTLATYNCEADRPYSDMYNWLMVFTPKLELKFAPLQFGRYPAITWFMPFNTGHRLLYLVMNYYRGTENDPNFIALYDNKGNPVRKKNIRMDEDWYYAALFSRDEDYRKMYIMRKDSVMSVDSMLNIRFVKKFHNISKANFVAKKDIDDDGEKEFIFRGSGQDNLKIFRNDFSGPVTLQLNTELTPYLFSVIHTKNENPVISISNDNSIYFFEYKMTALHRYGYLLFVPILLILLLFNYIIHEVREYRRLQIDNTQRIISELQVRSIQNQLDPHFTFNIFSSFANLISEKDTERADFVITKYAGLLKASVMNSEDIHITLQEELDFVKSYLELEKFRFPGKISFAIDIPGEIDRELRIPKMLLHIFVENAVKHGLRHLDSGGKIVINGFLRNGIVHISITDNGIGRAKAAEYAGFSTGKGLSIIDNILEGYNKLNRTDITYEIIDLYEGSKAAGTRVNIRIPEK